MREHGVGVLKGVVFAVVVLICVRGEGARKVGVEEVSRQRVVVLTDISNEPDDEESMVRFLVYSNEYDVEGLIATTSVWLKDKVRPDKIIERVEAYGQVRGNLLKHADGYPTKEYLLSVTKAGLPEFGMEGVGKGKSSEGSEHIIKVVDKADERPVWICVWGGATCLAQAIWDVRDRRTEAELDEFIAKLRVYTISDQDDSGRWMRVTFPKLFYIVTPSDVGDGEYYRATWTGISGDRLFRNGPMDKFELVDNPWLEENIINGHGALGKLYPRLKYIMEGDTPSFLGLINNGLGSALSPSYGGWGGRYFLYQTYAETRKIWTNPWWGRDTVTIEDGKSYTSAQATIWRWREAYQHDFAARMDWCVAEKYEEANHNPVVVVCGVEGKDVVRMEIEAGEEVEISAEGTKDPDGDGLSYKWFVYEEAGNYKGQIKLENSRTEKVIFTAPDVKGEKTIHLILEVKDDGKPNLYSYRRVIFTVRERTPAEN